MTHEEFQQATLGQLALLTGIDRHRWSRYLAGHTVITDKSLSDIAPTLGMNPPELLSAIIARRKVRCEEL